MSDTDKGFRLLHTMIRVKDLDKSKDFYSRHLGMAVLKEKEVPAGKYTNVFMGYGPDEENTVLELTYNWDQEEPYTHGSGFGHLAVSSPDVYATCAQMEREGVEIPRPAGPLKHGTRIIAFIKDPDGYLIELIGRD
ncbi:MAG: lactoylglutathione lyase [Rhodospirillales bacterium]